MLNKLLVHLRFWVLFAVLLALAALNAGRGQYGPPPGKKDKGDKKFMSDEEKMYEKMLKKMEKEFREQFMTEEEKQAEKMQKKMEKAYKEMEKTLAARERAQALEVGAEVFDPLRRPRPGLNGEEERRATVFRPGNLPSGLPAWFVDLDTDRDGQVGLYEWKQSGRLLEEFRKLDLNLDGLVTVEELLRALALQERQESETTPHDPFRFSDPAPRMKLPKDDFKSYEDPFGGKGKGKDKGKGKKKDG